MTDRGNGLGRFLREKREQVRPQDVGLTVAGGRRRVPGLRRDELALLSGISSEYYVRLEQGRDQNPSTQVLEALAGALRLDADATVQLFRLSRPLPAPMQDSLCVQDASAFTQQLIDSWPTTPALVIDRLTTVLAVNTLGRLLSRAHRPGINLLRALFLDPDVKALYEDWDAQAEALVASVRPAAGLGGDPAAIRLVQELSAHSEGFLALWEGPQVRPPVSGVSVLDHPRVGRLELRWEKLAVLSAPGPCANSCGQYLLVFQAEPASASARRLASLADAQPGAEACVVVPDAVGSSEHRVGVG